MPDKPHTIKRATIGIAVLLLFSKGIGFIREILIAHRFGTGLEYDTYLIAISIPVAFFMLFGYALYNIFVPAYGYARSASDKPEALSRMWADFGSSLLAALLLAGLICSFAPQLIRLIAPGLAESQIPQAALITRIASVILILSVLESFFRSILNGEKRFLLAACGPLITNLVFIFAFLMLVDRYSTKAILAGLVAGYAVQVVYIYFPFRKLGLQKYINLKFWNRHSDRFFETAIIILLTAAGMQLFSMIDRYLASSMASGVISALGYGYLIVHLAVDIMAYALSTAIFPYLTDAFAKKDIGLARYFLFRGIMFSILLSLPFMISFWFFDKEIIIMIFQRGAFDERSVMMTSALIKVFSWGLAGQFLFVFLTRAFYAARRNRSVIYVVSGALLVKLIVALFLIDRFDFVALAISTNISYIFAAGLLLILGNRSLAAIDPRQLFVYFTKLTAVGLAGFAGAWALDSSIVTGRETFAQLWWALPIAHVIMILIMAVAAHYLGLLKLTAPINGKGR